MKEEEEDEVLQEIPVFFSKTLADQLYLYQYPNEVGDLNFEQTPVISSSIKLSNQEVELTVKLDPQSNNYDYDKGERIGIEANGEPSTDPKKPNEKYFPRNLMDRMKLESRLAVPDSSNYVAGILHNNELHITPLKGIIHLRKSLSYLDHADKQAKSLAKEQGLEDSGAEEDEEEAKQVTVKFARQENDRYKLAKERSFNVLSKRSADEPWHHTEFHCASAELTKRERQRLYCSKKNVLTVERSEVGSQANIDRQIALLNLGNEDETQGDDPLSIHDLKKLPVADRVRNLLKEVKLIAFSRLLSLLNLEGDVVNALKVVQQVAVLVQGNWVVRSEILYKKDAVKTQMSPELMCRGRDYILYLFTQQRYVDRLKVSEVVKMSPENVKDILTQIARLKVRLGWEMLLPTDTEFLAKYPEVAQRQQLQWDMKQKQLKDACKGQATPSKTRRKSNRDSSVSDNDGVVEGSPKRKHRRKSQSLVLSSDNESGAEQRNNVVKNKRRIKVEPKES